MFNGSRGPPRTRGVYSQRRRAMSEFSIDGMCSRGSRGPPRK